MNRIHSTSLAVALGVWVITGAATPLAAMQSQEQAQSDENKDKDKDGTRGSVAASDVKDATKKAAAKTGEAVEKAAEATRDAVVTGAKKTKDVVSDAPAKIDETWITAKIAGKINADDALEDVDVDVKVKKNVVTITGDVPSEALRDLVLKHARETKGVKRVIDKMTLKPPTL